MEITCPNCGSDDVEDSGLCCDCGFDSRLCRALKKIFKVVAFWAF